MKKTLFSRLLCFGIVLSLLPAASVAATMQNDSATHKNIGPNVIAHRGASALAPENTLPAFQKAADLGADGIETDVQLTLDGNLVICHNYSIDGTSNGVGLIREKTLSELKTYDFGSWFSKEFTGVQIATLAEVLEKCKNFKVINIELKSPAERDATYITKVADVIKASGVMGKVIVSAFDHSLLRDLKKYMPELKVAALTLPNITRTLAKYGIDLSNYIPAGKVLTTLKVEDIKPIPQKAAKVIMRLGISGSTAETVVYELAQSSGTMFPGADWATVEKQIKLQSDLAKYVDSLDFKIEYLHPEYSTLLAHPEVVAEMHSRGIGVNVWTPNDATKLKQLYAIGVDGVITDKPDLAKKVFKLAGLFDDVNADTYYADAVLWAVGKNLVAGEGSFSPNEKITRGEMVSYLWKLAGSPEPAKAAPFTDVSSASSYTKAVRWAIENGITTGTSATTFSPNRNVTRCQAVTFLAHMAGAAEKATGYSHNFTDVSPSDYYNNSVAWAAANKITAGTSATIFSPKDDCLRGQIMIFLYKNYVKQ